MHRMAEPYDILIIGGGMVGLTLANLLRDSGLRLGIIEHNTQADIDADPNNDHVDVRVSAINRASLQVFESIGVLDAMLERAAAFEQMQVWDSTGAGTIHFDSADVGIDTLGYIIENSVIQNALLQNIKTAQAVDWLCPKQIESIALSDEFHHVTLADGETLSCRLLVGADGAKSMVREAAGIERVQSSYRQQGVVCTVSTEYAHANTAWQCFLPSGPLAFLPVFDGRCSIVWSLDDTNADEVLALDDETFARSLELAFEYQLGAITAVTPRAAFPLGHGYVRQYVQSGLALIGDAAHTIHPLAGQGANLGFMDAATLASVIQDALKVDRQWYAQHTLRRYERERKAENRLMETAMTGFKQLFGNNDPLLASLRNTGLNAVNHLPVLKRQFMRHAMGLNS